jgi:branched-chain amino acid transport system substrate-binding protein
MTPKHTALKAALLGSVLAMSSAAYAQEIKIGFNGDLSASPSAQSG